MRRVLLVIAALLATDALASRGAPRWFAVTAQEPPLRPAPPPHVVVMRSDQGDVRILYREGWSRRESAAHGYSFIHMTGPRGHTYGVAISAPGRPSSLSLSRTDDAPNDDESVDGVPTGAFDVVLGERCEVWAHEPTVSERVYGGPALSCITADGIVLWSGRAPPGADGPRIHSRAVAVERRVPAWSEFSFPREALDWSYWSSRFLLPPESARPAYEIRFGEQVVRVRGDLRYESRPAGFSIWGPDIRLYYAAPETRPVSFSISTGRQRPFPHPLSGGSERMDRPALRVSGERCSWHRIDLSVRWGIIGVCVTDDGILFAESTDFHDEAHQDRFRIATSFRRGAPEAALMSPPQDLFEPWVAALPR
ncbi:MAG: hypothetical protein K2P58_08430 [Hyphomonadaceae bacterium]|nr:hypothetical protein [Hyphomonadaceae bacterium]